MAPDSGRKKIEPKARQRIASYQKKLAKEPDKQERAKLNELIARLKQAIEDEKANRETEDRVWAEGHLAQDEENEGGPGQATRQGDIEGEDDEEDEEDEEEEGAEEGSEQAEEDQENPAKKKIKENVDKLKEEAKDEVKKRLWEAAKKQLAQLWSKLAATVVEFLAADGWWIILIIIALILIGGLLYWLLAGNTQKGSTTVGGSTPLYATAEADQGLIDEINGLKDAGILFFADGTDKDLEWVDRNGKKESQLDIRTLNTLKYLGSKWDLIRIRIARSNGPDLTRRGVGTDGEIKNLDTISAFSTGQAIGIDQIGTYSDEIAQKPECAVTTNTPIDVGTQEILDEASLRPLYEQLSVDAESIYGDARTLSSNYAPALPTDQDYAAAKSQNTYVVAQRTLEILKSNLSWLVENGSAWELDSQTVTSFGVASTQIEIALSAVQGLTGDSLAEAWKDQSKTRKPIQDGITAMFSGMQRANMIGWYGSVKDGCKLWKAYEARQHVRKLVEDLVNMPTDASFSDGSQKFNTGMVPAQVVVYGNEDASLDDGIPRDVFPPGRMTVSDAGPSFDLNGVDGEVDVLDEHFVGMPQDKGVFAKPGPIFIYRGGRDQLAGSILADFAPSGAMEEFQKKWDRADLLTAVGDRAARVTYKDFVLVSF